MVGSIFVEFFCLFNKDVKDDFESLKNLEKLYNITILNGKKFYAVKRTISFPINDNMVIVIDPIFFQLIPMTDSESCILKINWDRVINIEKRREKEISSDKLEQIDKMIDIVHNKMKSKDIIVDVKDLVFSLYKVSENEREEECKKDKENHFYQ